MPRLRVLRHLTISKISLVGLSLLILWLVRLGLWLLPFGSLRRAVSRVRRRGQPSSSHMPPERIARAVEIAGYLVPRATCLAKALAAHVLLRRWGHEGVLHVGVAHGEGGKFEAHAWLECEGKVIVGRGPRRFVPLPPIPMGE